MNFHKPAAAGVTKRAFNQTADFSAGIIVHITVFHRTVQIVI